MQQQYKVQQKSIPYKIEGEVLNWGKCICAVCGNKGKIGTTTKPTAQNPVVKVLCYDCALKDLADRHSISIKEAKDRHEKNQKSMEILAKIILERYKEETGKKPPKNMEGLTEIMKPGMEWWNSALSEADKLKISQMSKDEQKEYFKKAPLFPQPKVPVINTNQTGRNDPCTCGSGKKYKKCCLDKAA